MPTSEFDIASLFREAEKGGDVASVLQARLRPLLRLLLEVAWTDTRREAPLESAVVPHFHDVLGLLRSGIKSAEFHTPYLRDSFSAEPGDTIRDEDEDQPGKHKIIFKTKDGAETCYRGLPLEARDQPHTSRAVQGQRVSGTYAALEPLSPSDNWVVFTNTEAQPASRVRALARLLYSPLRSDALAYLACELSRADIRPPEWRDAAVFAAEDTHFPPELREGAGEALLNIALTLRNQPSGPEKVVWSALRRAASLLPTRKADRLLAFLAPNGTVDTRSVALQCVSRMYEAEPPSSVPLAVADRAYRFAERFLDPDVFTPGEPSVIARNALSALAAVGDQRLGDALAAVRALGRSWLIRRVRDELSRIYRGWIDRGFSPKQSAVANLGHALASFV